MVQFCVCFYAQKSLHSHPDSWVRDDQFYPLKKLKLDTHTKGGGGIDAWLNGKQTEEASWALLIGIKEKTDRQ